MFRTTVSLLLVFVVGVILVGAHVRMMEPINRSSIFRDPRFNHLQPEPNWDDDGLYCGRVHQQVVIQNCGICGDPFTDSTPRPNEHGGVYGRGIIVETYRSGQIFDIDLEFTTTHLGYVEFHLCDRIPETEDCFNRNVLQLVSGGTKVPVTVNGGNILIRSRVHLPAGLTCSHCALRMHYRAGNNWGNCGNGTEGMGCGLQETFRSCADIAIV